MMSDGPQKSAAATTPPPARAPAPAPAAAPQAYPAAMAPAATATSSVSPPSVACGTGDALQPLLLIQAFDGSWQLDQVAIAIGAKFPIIVPKLGLPDAVWATAIALAFLKVSLGDREPEWALVAAKARLWLVAAGHNADDLVVHACEVLQQ